MSRYTEFRLVAACMTGGVSVALFGVVMMAAGARPLPVSFLVAMGAGGGFGWWRTGRIVRRWEHDAFAIPTHTPARTEEPPVSIQQITGEQMASVHDAPMVDLPATTPGTAGNILNVRSIGILPEPPTPYVRTMDGTPYRLPADLYKWVDSLLSHCIHGNDHGEPPILPARIEFCTQDGAVRAELLEETEAPR